MKTQIRLHMHAVCKETFLLPYIIEESSEKLKDSDQPAHAKPAPIYPLIIP